MVGVGTVRIEGLPHCDDIRQTRTMPHITNQDKVIIGRVDKIRFLKGIALCRVDAYLEGTCSNA